mgnify:FL=1
MKNKFTVQAIIYVVVFAILSLSIIFSSRLQIALMLKPDMTKVNKNGLTVHFVDVGQGDATLIRFPNNKTMIIDSGSVDAKPNLVNYINNVFFSGYNKHFDYVMLTHPDSDHMGNMVHILQNYSVGTLLRPNIVAKGLELGADNVYASSDEEYLRLVALAYQKNIAMKFVTNTTVLADISSYMRILSPIKSTYDNDNSFSPMLMISHNNTKILLTGDATIENEIEVINTYNTSKLDCDILKLAHHGANTSTSDQFLNIVTPSVGVISYGKDNSYLHPSSETLTRINNYSQNNNVDLINNIYETAKQGNIIFNIDQNDYSITTIKNINDYIFVDYYVVVLITEAILFITIVLPNIIKHVKQLKKDKK